MHISKTSFYTTGLVTGVLASSLFTGGNLVISFISTPSILAYGTPQSQLQQWATQYDMAKRLFGPLSVFSGIGFGIAAYFAPSQIIRRHMIFNALITASAIPFTVIFMAPMIRHLKEVKRRGSESEAGLVETRRMLKTWVRRSTMRSMIVALGFLNGMREITDCIGFHL
ncbi:hypothetical protein NEOLI_003050 [Neolecta irregularis DAH-3]|uniref:Uncharacterized protein n=1 Tax=Neolecta irregularis (strain DAH-3) TaxID=1198029 RepID=A0A1U7LPB0_NEOID|nr:hypothetical protein NEOLI_003050 [Neolecta irregularis DAH-3]|eukprot:OLL24382.1 hypothetical protein NEOLI_003050 [Neolecta irregularis DAH-3]